MRCFIALAMEDGWAGDLAGWLDAIRGRTPGVAVTPAGNLHLTLAFLGEVDAEQAGKAARALDATAGPAASFAVAFAGTGAFPSSRRPQVFWLGVDETAQAPLRRLHGALADALAAVGLPPERRAFRPHLTLGRVRRAVPPAQARELMALFEAAPRPSPVPALGLALYQSRLGRDAAVHERLHQAGFGGVGII